MAKISAALWTNTGAIMEGWVEAEILLIISPLVINKFWWLRWAQCE